MATHTDLRNQLKEGLVIPAHPLALDENLKLAESYQRALTRYYLAAGAGGLAVGVHTTQFEIHDEDVGLYEPVLEIAQEEVQREVVGSAAPVMVAGLVGDTDQAVREADTAREMGYDCGLLSMGALSDASTDYLIEHAQAVAEQIPLFGFYLQPAVGGRELPYEFWRRLAEIENLVGIKIAPFDRYRTIDVVRAIAQSGRQDEIALYTGNDDNIINDLLTEYPFGNGIHIEGGLLGQWAVWTRKAVQILEQVKEIRSRSDGKVPQEILTRNIELTDANAAIFDPQNNFKGSIAGIHEILRRQGLLPGRFTLSDEEVLSPGQKEEIDRVYDAYPHLTDDKFVRAHRDEWLS